MNNFFKITPERRRVKVKKKAGVIYSNPRWWKRIIFYLGSFLALFSVVGILYIYGPIINSWIKYKMIDQNAVVIEVKKIVEENKNQDAGVTQVAEIPKENIPENEPESVSNEFRVNIPKIGANAEVIANVSPFDKKEYMSVLKNNTVAHSSESSFPDRGKGTTVYMFAHSSQQGVLDARDNSVFYLLGELKDGDDVLVNYKGKIFTYRVYMQKVVKAKETEYLNYKDSDKEILILQTCWPIGTNWQRLLVFAERI